MSLPTASSLARGLGCLASCVLPRAERAHRDGTTRGVFVHKFLARVPEVGRDAALAEVPDEFRDYCEAIDLSALPSSEPGAWSHEVAWAYDIVSGAARVLGTDIDRRYEVGATEIAGTADAVGLTMNEAVVVDFKGAFYDVGPAEQNVQLLMYALMACRAYGRSRAIVQIINVGETIRKDTAVIEAAALDAFAMRLVEWHWRLEEIRRDPRPPPATIGDWCDFCPSLQFCPAQISLLRAVADEPLAMERQIASSLTPLTAKQAYRRLRDVQRVVNVACEALKLYAAQNPIDLGDGYVYGPTKPSERIVSERALPVLQEHYGEAFARDAGRWETSKDAIKKAAAKHAKERGVPAKKLADAVIDVLREEGALRAGDAPVKEHRVKGED